MSNIKGNIDQGVHVGLVRVANLIADAMKKKLSSGYPAGDSTYGWVPIQDTIVIGQVITGNGESSIQITLGGERAPYAAAYEWGSGIHSTQGPAHYITIPKLPGVILKIPRSRWKGYNPPPDVDPVFLRRVSHPGVAPKPYIEPSIIENKKEVKRILAREFKASILIGRNRITEIKVGA